MGSEPNAPGAPSHPLRSRDGAILAALGLAGALVPWVLWGLFDVPVIGGADPGMWEEAALGITRWEASPVAPIYPLLLVAAVWATGAAWDVAGMAIAIACYAALPPATWLLLRRLGVARSAATTGALLAVGEPWLALGSLQAQPDTLTALVIVLTMLAALAWVATPKWPQFAALLLAMGLVSEVREHAPVVTAGLLLLLAAAPGGIAKRAGRSMLAVIALAFVPTLLGEVMVLPWQQHWVVLRWGALFRDIGGSAAPSFLSDTPPDYRRAFAGAYAAHDRLGLAWLHLRMNVYHGWTPWAWLAAGAVGWLLLGKRRRVVWIGFLPVGAVLGGAQQPRHVAVLVPLAAACWVAGALRIRRWGRFLAPGVPLALVVAGILAPGHAPLDQRMRCGHRAEIKAAATRVCAAVGPDAVAVGGNPRPQVYCVLPKLGLREAAALDVPLVWFGDLPEGGSKKRDTLMADGWEKLDVGDDHFPVWVRPARARTVPAGDQDAGPDGPSAPR